MCKYEQCIQSKDKFHGFNVKVHYEKCKIPQGTAGGALTKDKA